jgi:hypothetical protein
MSAWRYISTAPHVLMAWCLIKHSDDFILNRIESNNYGSEMWMLSRNASRKSEIVRMRSYDATARLHWARPPHIRRTPWSWALLEKPPVVKLPKNFPTFYGTWRFITVFTRPPPPPLVPILSRINPAHTIASYLRSILILSTHLLLGHLTSK